ncbi:MAG: hypothetical protein WHX52_00860 [Anaerolineae bacterium]
MVKVALVYNLIHPEQLNGLPVDILAEYDSEETIAGLRAALESAGHTVTLLEADETIAPQLKATAPDIVFNIAEGRHGESRESYIPLVCEMLKLPYTGSGPLTLALCLNKARTKEILLHYGIFTPRFQVMEHPDEPLNPKLRFPLIVKLIAEGSSIGLSENSVVDDEAALRRQVAYLIDTYAEPVLVEEFIEGREFTIGILGNHPPRPLPITEVVFSQPRGIVLFEPDPAVIARFPELWGGFTVKIPPPIHLPGQRHAGASSSYRADGAARVPGVGLPGLVPHGNATGCRRHVVRARTQSHRRHRRELLVCAVGGSGRRDVSGIRQRNSESRPCALQSPGIPLAISIWYSCSLDI